MKIPLQAKPRGMRSLSAGEKGSSAVFIREAPDLSPSARFSALRSQHCPPRLGDGLRDALDPKHK
jgi:hypothetical protein